jgi:hypothetical protein
MYLNVPRINQHARYGAEGYHYCTVATTEMYLWWANGRPLPDWHTIEWIYDGGGSGARVAQALNESSPRQARCVFNGASTRDAILHCLASGYPVPLGVDCLDATIHGTGTVSRSDLQVGDAHPRGVGNGYGDGHWVLIIGYDSSYLYINDPDTGTTLRMTYKGAGNGLESSAGADGNKFAVISTATQY